MTRQRAFQTAAARRRSNPIEWVIDDVTVRLRANVELAEVAALVEALQEPLPEGKNEILGVAEKRGKLIELVRTFLEPGAVEHFDKVSDDLDFVIIAEMVQELIMEYTGQTNPTPAPSSSDGS